MGKQWPAGGRAASALTCALLPAMPVSALMLTEQPVETSLESTLSVGAAWSTASPDPEFIGLNKGGNALSEAGDDGRLNFRRGDLVSQVIKGVHGLSVRYGDSGLFVRGKYWYDVELHDGERPFKPIRDHGRERAARTRGAQLLDAYVDHRFELAAQPGLVRLGRQVVNWGESTFLRGGINAINPVDVPAFRRPGAEVREGLLPTELLYLSQSLSDNVTVELFYQLHWEASVLENCGTFFSTADIVAPGCDDNLAMLITRDDTYDALYAQALAGGAPPATAAVIADTTLAALVAQGVRWGMPDEGVLMPRAPDREARDAGQYGVALTTWLPAAATELGLYAMTYHSRTPYLGGMLPDTTVYTNAAGFGALAPVVVGANARYYLSYPEDIRLYGASFSTSLPGGLAWSGEVSYRPNLPVQVNATDIVYAGVKPLGPAYAGASPLSLVPGQDYRGYQRKEVTQWQTSLIGAFGPVLGAAQLTLAGEVGAVHTGGLASSRDVRYGAGPGGRPGAECDTGGVLVNYCHNEGYVTRTAWGYRTRAMLRYNDVFAGVNLRPSLAWSHDVQGDAGNGVFSEGARAVSVALDADYLNSWYAGISYTDYLTHPGYSLGDRDFVAVSLSVSF
jgi:hypothetical protein